VTHFATACWLRSLFVYSCFHSWMVCIASTRCRSGCGREEPSTNKPQESTGGHEYTNEGIWELVEFGWSRLSAYPCTRGLAGGQVFVYSCFHSWMVCIASTRCRSGCGREDHPRIGPRKALGITNTRMEEVEGRMILDGGG
jgi:hypothetical protein